VRPEHLVEVNRLPGFIPGMAIPVTVDIVELLGNENFVYLLNRPNGRKDDDTLDVMEIEAPRTGTTLLTARMAPDVRIHRGDHIEVSALPENLHFFDPESEQAIR
jgi:ABC-type sugar transport system ATPase subunit